MRFQLAYFLTIPVNLSVSVLLLLFFVARPHPALLFPSGQHLLFAVTVSAHQPLFADLIIVNVSTHKLPFVAPEFFAVIALRTQLVQQQSFVLQPVFVLLAHSVFAIRQALTLDYQPVSSFLVHFITNFTSKLSY